MASLLLCGLLSSPTQGSAVFRLPVSPQYSQGSYYFASGRFDITNSADYTTDTYLGVVAGSDSLKIYEITMFPIGASAAVNDVYWRPAGITQYGTSWTATALAARDDEVGYWVQVRAAAVSAYISFTFTFPEGVKRLVFCANGSTNTASMQYVAVVGR